MFVRFLAGALFKLVFQSRILEVEIEKLKMDVRDETKSLGFIMLLGTILTSTVVLAIFYGAQSAQLTLGELENATFYQLIFFGVIGITALGLLVFLFKKDLRGKPPRTHSLKTDATLLKSGVFSEFADGFVAGYLRPRVVARPNSGGRKKYEFR